MPAPDHVIRRDGIHLFFDPDEPPRLRVKSGDRIRVETEDAGMGSVRSERDVYASIGELFEKLGGANPVTGPIFVEGVAPGDCVAITIEDIVPGAVQHQGYTALTPGIGGLIGRYGLQDDLPPRTVICPIEDKIIKFPARGGFIDIPVSPFLGTIGVAPAQERRLAFSQGADFGGNTDIPLHGIGATLVFRANVAGALISLGDAHAAQGDGEIAGAAVECQADVTLLVERIAAADAHYVALPQVNTETFIGSVAGLGGVNLGDTVRSAYVDIIRRLERFHGFSRDEAYLLACQTAKVRIGQVVDPLYSAAVTIERRYIQ
ncbi:acetamidase/formamidase family protein [Devosia sp.]|uniref:acetamidase/formamidase family protein n=1 Tax=Devosia sp. TaxID=1871048 RepID=UPI002F0A390C